jgi:predicted ATPase
VRLLTLTGPGGTGKTRLALQAGSTLLHAFKDGVFFCDLSPVGTPDLVPSAIAEVLSVKQEAGHTVLESLQGALAGKHLLLVLDNFEQVADACSVVASLLDACRDLHILVTSRIPLHLSREREYPVPPLAVPDPEKLPDLDALSEYESVALFLERAGAVKPGFTVTNENAPAIAEICVRLDGLPLAIELAAARIKLFPPRALLQRLDNRLKLLTGGAKDRPTRQQTLRGAIDWSYSLLTEEEQALFARLSVFAGGWDFEAAETVCNADGDLDLFEGIASLVDKSLVRQQGEDEPRFTMLETIREYATEKLAERGESGVVQDAHAAYFVALAQEADPALRGPAQTEWIERLDAEIPNLWAAVNHLVDTGRLGDAVEILALYDYFILRIHSLEALRWLELINDRVDESIPPRVRGKALWAYAGISTWARWGVAETQRDLIPYLDRAIPLLQEVGESYLAARSITCLGNIYNAIGDWDKSLSCYEQALEIVRALGNHRAEGILYQNLAMRHSEVGEDEAAEKYFTRGTPIIRASGDLNILGMQLFMHGAFLVYHNRLVEARPLLMEAMPIFERHDRPNWIGLTLHALGVLALKEGDLDIAEERMRRALGIFVDHDSSSYVVEILGSFAALALARGAPRCAAILLSATYHLVEAMGVFFNNALSREYPHTLARVREALDEETWQQAEARGTTMSLGEAIAYALEVSW